MATISFNGVPLLSQKPAIQLDQDLMTVPGFSVDQLMELAGLSVASAVYEAYPNGKKILAIVGPGNNGGDALVAARHLKHFGWDPVVVYPKPTEKMLFKNLVTQIEQLEIKVEKDLPENFDQEFDVILDGIFGFSFDPSGGIRAPFDDIMTKLIDAKTPICAIDIPSGWDVEKGNTIKTPSGKFMEPDMLISLSAPKVGAKFFKGTHHYLGGRFLPPHIIEKYNLQGLPKYLGTNQIVKLDWKEKTTNDVKADL